MTTAPSIEGLLRDLAPRVLGAVVRRHGGVADWWERARRSGSAPGLRPL